MTDRNTKESGLQRYTGIKKYGKKGFEELQKAGRGGASEEEKGAIKDKYLKKKTNEGLADLAGAAERDHEVQMARAELYKIAKYAIKLHEMLKNVSEEQGLEGWVQSKITKSADYIGSVYHNLDYEMKFGSDGGGAGPEMEIQVGESQDPEMKKAHDAGYRDASQGKKKNPYNPGSPLAKQYDAGHEAHKRHFSEASHQSKTTMKHIKNPTAGEKKAAKDIKPGIKGYKDRADMLKSAEKDGRLKEDPFKARLHTLVTEKAKSKAQQKFMGMVYAAKKGEPAASPDVAKAAKGMSKKAAKDYAATKHKGKPEHVKKD